MYRYYLHSSYCQYLGVSVVSLVNDWVQEVSKHLIRLLISSHTAHGHDEWVTRVVNTWIRRMYIWAFKLVLSIQRTRWAF